MPTSHQTRPGTTASSHGCEATWGDPPGPQLTRFPCEDAHSPLGPIRAASPLPQPSPGPPAPRARLVCLVSVTSAWGGLGARADHVGPRAGAWWGPEAAVHTTTEAVGMERRAGWRRADQASPLTPQPPWPGCCGGPAASWTHLRDDEEVVPGLTLNNKSFSPSRRTGSRGIGHRQTLPLLRDAEGGHRERSREAGVRGQCLPDHLGESAHVARPGAA